MIEMHRESLYLESGWNYICFWSFN